MTLSKAAIFFLSDFGLADEWVGVCRAVIQAIAADTVVVDLAHDIPPFDVRHGAFVLLAAARYLPSTAICLAVVDPGVGTGRRPVAVRTAPGHVFVGPDNGLLAPAIEALGGAKGAAQLTNPKYHLPDVSMTFHARDIFAPAAAHLASGVTLTELGPAIDPVSLAPAPWGPPHGAEGGLVAQVICVDRFGALRTNVRREDVDAFGLRASDKVTAVLPTGKVELSLVRIFAEVAVGELALLVDSSDHLCLVANQAGAAQLSGLSPGMEFCVIRKTAGGSAPAGA